MKRKKLNIFIVIILTIIVLYFSLKDDYQKILPILFSANKLWLLIAYLFVLNYTFLKSLVTHNIINDFKEYSIFKTLKLQLMTFFFNAATPFSSGGQPFQIYVLNKNKISLASSTNIIVQTTIIHQIAVFIVLLCTIIVNAILKIYELNFTESLLITLSFLVNAITLMFLIILSQGKKIDNVFGKFIINVLTKIKIVKNKELQLEKWEKSVSEFNAASKRLLVNKKRLVGLIFTNVLAIISLYIVPMIILFSLENNNSLNIIETIVLTSFVSIISCYVPLPGGSLGQEYLFTLFFSIYLKNPLLTSLMLLWRLITYYIPMIIGAIIFNVDKKR